MLFEYLYKVYNLNLQHNIIYTEALNITELSGFIVFQLDSSSSVSLSRFGPGVWVGANSNSSVAVGFTLSDSTPATLALHGDTHFGLFSAHATKDGSPFDITSIWGTTTSYLFEPGLYEFYLSSSQGPGSASGGSASASMTLTLATPLPGAVWLFGPSLAIIGAMGRRLAQRPDENNR